jgi:hypothetical protein
MRVGIYAYGPTSVQLTGSAKLLTFSSDPKGQQSTQIEAGSHPLSRGIYLILPHVGCAVSAGGGCDLVALDGDKDDWPDPKGQIAAFDAAFASVEYKSLKEFFTIAKGLKAISA